MSELELCQSVLKKNFGYSTFRKGQWPIIESVLAGRDAVGVLPTGGGKSLCFQVPALARKGITIVISPLVALMQDQTNALRKLGIAAGALYAKQDLADKRQIFQEIKNSDHYLLYLSPERVQKSGFASWISQQKVNLVAIDEAHCISQWGPDFRTDYEKLDLVRSLIPNAPILALTATATPSVLTDIERRLKLNITDRHVYGFYRSNLYYQSQLCENDDEKLSWTKQALQQTPKGRVIIYCGTRKQTEAVAMELQQDIQNVGFYHAGMSAEERKSIQQSYDRGDLRILTATNAFGMGIDHPDVRLVIQFQLPPNVEALYQQMGRAGRDGKKSTCLLLHSKKDYGLQSYFIRNSDSRAEVIQRRWRALDAMVQFAEGAECRHAEILTYFKDSDRIGSCGHCDICSPDSVESIANPEFSDLQTPRKKKKKKDHQPLMADAAALYDRIKSWRKEYARSKDIPAFVVFTDRTLIDLCNTKPQSKDSLKGIHGLGEHKVETFGEELIDLLRH